MRRDDSPNYYLRWGGRWESLGHPDLAAAKYTAKKRAGALLAAKEGARGRALRLGELLNLYALGVTPTKSRAQQKEDQRRIDLWEYVLGRDFDPLKLTGARLRAFERDRRAGNIAVPGRKLQKVGAKSVREDLAFLKAVFGWASSMASGWVLERNPMTGYDLPREINPNRPRAYWEDFVALQGVAAQVHPLFTSFMALIESLGWRVSAVCQISASDFDPERTNTRPHGRLLKRAESDKVGVRRWTIIPESARRALDDLLVQGGCVGNRWLFPADKAPQKPWTRHYARSLLYRAWRLTDVPTARRVGFHSFRRKWVDERKHLPEADVAAQGGWLSVRTLHIYQAPDEATLLAVAEEPKKLKLRLNP